MKHGHNHAHMGTSVNDEVVEVSPLLQTQKHGHSHSHGHSHHGHSHSHGSGRFDVIKMIIMLLLVFGIFGAETGIGIYTNSLTLVSDALHMFSDFLSLTIGLVALIMAKRPRSERMSYGWGRLETLGGFTNGIFLVSVVMFIYHEAITRFIEPQSTTDKPYIILAMGGAGFIVNLFGMILFCGHAPMAGHDHSSKNHNMGAIFIHMAGDFLGSVGVMVSAGLIWKFPPEKNRWAYYVDPGMSTLMATIILFSAIPLVINSGKVLIQSVPHGVNLNKIAQQVSQIPGVRDVHEIHVWKLVNNRNIGSLHVKCQASDFMAIAPQVNNIMHDHGVHSTTIQPEFVEGTDTDCHLGCAVECDEHRCCPKK